MRSSTSCFRLVSAEIFSVAKANRWLCLRSLSKSATCLTRCVNPSVPGMVGNWLGCSFGLESFQTTLRLRQLLLSLRLRLQPFGQCFLSLLEALRRPLALLLAFVQTLPHWCNNDSCTDVRQRILENFFLFLKQREVRQIKSQQKITSAHGAKPACL